MIRIAQMAHANGFAQKWNHKGVTIFLDDVHKQFAVDFANVMLNSFIEAKQREEAAKAKPKVISTEE